MMKKAIITSLICASALVANADVWSLDSCINYALDHNLTVRSRQVDQYGGELSVTEARDRYLPQVNGYASQSFAFGRGLTAANTYDNRNTSSFGWGVNLNLPIFQGLSAYRQEKLARANLVALAEQTEATREDITVQVIASYLQALYCRELVAVSREQLRISDLEIERRQALYDNGKIPHSDLLDARASRAADSLSLVNGTNELRLALLDLSQLLNLDFDPDFDIAPLPADDEGITLDADAVYANALANNHALAAARASIGVADRQVDLARTGYIPSLSFSLGAGSSYYRLNGADNPSFSRQMRDNYATNLGFNLSIPIFDAFSTRNNIRRANVQRTLAELQYESARENVFKTIQTAWTQAVGARNKVAAAKVAVDAAKEAFEAMQVKYEFGRSTPTEFEASKSAYIKALADLVQARYELILRNRILIFYNRS